MRMLFISNLYPPNVRGGAERLAANLAGELAGRHQISVLTSQSHHSFPSNVLPQLKVWAPYTEPLRVTAKQYIRVGRWNYRTTCQAIEQVDPQVVFISDLKRLSYAPLVAAQRLRPTLTFLHDPHSFGLVPARTGLAGFLHDRYNALRYLYPTVAVDYALSNSEFSLASQPEGVQIKNQRVIWVGIRPPETLAAIKAEYLPQRNDNGRRLMYVGRIDREKGIHDIITAVSLLVKRHGLKGVKLDVAGYVNDEAYLEELKALVVAEGLEEQVEFVGPVSEEEKFRRLCLANAMIFSSNWMEGIGVTYMEAMLCRTPCVCSPAGGAAEVLKDGDNALLFEGGDPASMAASLLKLFADKKLRDRIVEAATRMMEERFTMAKFAERFEQAVDECLELTGQGAAK